MEKIELFLAKVLYILLPVAMIILLIDILFMVPFENYNKSLDNVADVFFYVSIFGMAILGILDMMILHQKYGINWFKKKKKD